MTAPREEIPALDDLFWDKEWLAYDDPPAVDIFLITNPRSAMSRAERLFLTMLHDRLDAAPRGHYVYPGA